MIATDGVRQILGVRGRLAPVPVDRDIGAGLEVVGSSKVKVIVAEHVGNGGSTIVLAQSRILGGEGSMVEFGHVDHGVVAIPLARIREGLTVKRDMFSMQCRRAWRQDCCKDDDLPGIPGLQIAPRDIGLVRVLLQDDAVAVPQATAGILGQDYAGIFPV